MLPASCSSCSPYLLIVFTRAAEDEQQPLLLKTNKRQHKSNRLRFKPILLHFATYHPPFSQMEEETGRDPSCKPKSSSFTTPTLLPPNINHHNAHNRRLGLGPRDPGLFPDWWYYYYYYYYYHHHHHHHHLNPYPPSILPLPPPPPSPPLPRHLLHPPPPPLLRRSQLPLSPRTVASSSDVRDVIATPPSGSRELRATFAVRNNGKVLPFAPEESLAVARRPDDGGREGRVVPLLANHFLVKFDPDHRIYHYNVNITPSPSREVARMIKQELVREKSSALSGSLPAFDGRSNLYSPVEFQKDRLDFFVSLPMPAFGSALQMEELDGTEEPNKRQKHKLFRINMKLVSELDGKGLSRYLSRDKDEPVPLPQDYLQALDIVLRDSASEKCITVGRSMYSSSMCGRKDIGGGAICLRGFFQSLRPTQQGLALNIDYSVTAFHESIGVIPYLEKRLEFLRDLSKKKSRSLSAEERREVEKALKNIRVFVCHRETVQRYCVYSLTKDSTEDLWFVDKDGKNLKLLNYFEDHYGYEIQYRNLPCLQASRGKACYLPMELCMICEGQKFLGQLSDDQTVRILRMGCQRPKERKAIIKGVMHGRLGPTSENQDKDFKLNVSREMTRVNGRVLQPPKLKLGDRGQVRDLFPSRQDRQWNLLDSHVVEGIRIEKWALISFGGTPELKLMIPNFVTQLSHRCERLGIHLARTPSISPMFESNQLLNNVSLLESKLKNVYKAASNGLQLLLCVMERKHRGYADLKRIAETTVGIVTQCCLYSNLGKPNSQFLANLSLKINAKVGGCTVALYNSLPGHIPRLLRCNEPVMFMGADVTHPHPLDDSSPSIAAVVGSVNWPAANKYVSRMRSQTHRQEIIEDLCEMVRELFEDFRQEVGELPKRIIFFRDGVSETQFRKVLKEEVMSLREACSKYSYYNPLFTFAVVQKRHHTRLFPEGSDLPIFDENIPPGTVVDTGITHPREFDFYLCSHWGVKGTSRPTHYHVLLDESGFTSDELQKLVYNLCYTFVRCTKPISLVPPVYYAHLAAYRGRLYLERSENMGSTRNGGSQLSRSGPPKARPLPKLSDNLRKLMFYC